ncbi:MAG TPA: hypothetical protein V6C72_13410 [Chroococcales cyanobacterium]
MLVIEEFAIKDTSVICPSCNTVFATPVIARMPNITKDSAIEADLHRVMPDARIRAALLSMCPACIYTWWQSAFSAHYILPQLVVESPEIEYSKKFGYAVKSGRENGAHSLDTALMALNGCWCAREEHQAAGTVGTAEYHAVNDRWLMLAAQELEAALADSEWEGNRSRYHYIMGEVLRQLRYFDQAVKHFNIVDRRSMLPRQLVEHQKQLAEAQNYEPTRLPPFIVEELFLSKPPAINSQNQHNQAISA